MFKSIDTLQNILNSPEDYIDTTKYFSWENYFTEVLSKIVGDTPAIYTKKELNICYHQDCCSKGKGICKFFVKGDKKKLILGEIANLIELY